MESNKEVTVRRRRYTEPVEIKAFSPNVRAGTFGRVQACFVPPDEASIRALVDGEVPPKTVAFHTITADMVRQSISQMRVVEEKREQWGDTTIIFVTEYVDEAYWYGIDGATIR